MESSHATPLRDTLASTIFKVTTLSTDPSATLIIQQRFLDKFSKNEHTSERLKELIKHHNEKYNTSNLVAGQKRPRDDDEGDGDSSDITHLRLVQDEVQDLEALLKSTGKT